ncbi:MAG: hypothetical protein ABR929_12485 [Roseiarcus sp.]|jgi:uncharacterized protein (DUF952 family)
MTLIFKIVGREEWRAAEAASVFVGAPLGTEGRHRFGGLEP